MSPSVEHNIRTYILELVQDQLTRRQTLDSVTRNLLKLLTVTCGYNHIRLLVSQRLEMWLQNPKVKSLAMLKYIFIPATKSTYTQRYMYIVNTFFSVNLHCWEHGVPRKAINTIQYVLIKVLIEVYP